MPTSATTAGGTRQGTAAKNQQVLPSVPFIRASTPHREPGGIDVSRQVTTSDQDLGVFDIPAYGYVRSIVLVVQLSGGSGGSAVVSHEDSPFNILKSISLTEPNGAILSQFSSGYHLQMAHKWGGFRHPLGSDFRQSPTFSPLNATGSSATYLARFPVEINLRDGLGSLPNQNAAATFKLRMTLAKAADFMVGGTLPTTMPTVRVRAYVEEWDQPEVNSGGAANQLTPPAMNTTQFWSEQVYNVNAGLQTIRLTRVGNYIRNLIFIFRAAGGTRATVAAQFPDPLTLLLDTRPLDVIEVNNFRHQMFEVSGFGAQYADAATLKAPSVDQPGALDNSVWVYDFCHEFDGLLGRENRDLWLPTLGSSRLEIQGTFGSSGSLTVLTNDVAIAGSVFL